jgi:hypothetical protein
MEEYFKDIIAINGVQGVILLDAAGKVVFESVAALRTGIKQRYTNWKKLLDTVGNIREADFVFDNGRVYLRKTENGYLLVSMQSFASIAMVKLNCDILLPQLKSDKNKGLKALFRR